MVAMAGADNAMKLVGVWENTKSNGAAANGTTLEFMKDGKLKLVAKEGKEEMILNGTYKVKDDKISVTLNSEGKSKDVTLTIKKLTE